MSIRTMGKWTFAALDAGYNLLLPGTTQLIVHGAI